MVDLIGTGRTDVLSATTDLASFIAGEGGKDTLTGGRSGDVMLGGGGNDVMSGNGGDDQMFGATTAKGVVDMSKFKITEDVKASVTFDFEEAGFKNTLGVYKIAADGSIHDVQVLFANASLKGSGGDLVAGKSTVDLALSAGDRLGFFIVPDAFSQKGMDKLLSDKKASWKLVDAAGQSGNVDGGKPLKLVHVDKNGRSTDVQGQYGTTVFHSVDNGSSGLNGDKMKHVVGEVDVASGTVKIGFEDLMWGGDRDFDDSVFTVRIGTTNSALLSKETNKPSASSDDDTMSGGTGHDQMFGMRGNDQMSGEDGNDRMWGNSGDDVLDGGAGNDTLSGGKGDDVLTGGEGNDEIAGDSGNDRIMGDAGNDRIDGGAGFDTLDYSAANGAMAIDLHAGKASGEGMGHDTVKGVEGVVGSAFDDVIKGNKVANVLVGGGGDDVLRGLQGADTLTGGEGVDTFVFGKADVMRDGVHQGVDTITDFSKSDKLDISALLNGQKWGEIGEVVAVKDDGKSSHVFAKFDGAFHEVAVLEGVTGMSASDMLKDGTLLA